MHSDARRAAWTKPHAYLSFAAFLGSAFASLALYRFADLFRRPSSERGLARVSRWCRWGCRRLGLQVHVDGTPPNEHCLYIANHRTYLDIPVLTSVLGATFLGRGDVAGWPLIGSIARLTDAVLVRRDDTRDRGRAAMRIARRLETTSVVVFAEGTTTGDRLPGNFHTGIFRLARRLGVPVVPVSLRYSDRRAYWIEDLGLGQHLTQRVFPSLPLRVAVHIGKPLRASDFANARELLAAARAAVCAPIEAEGELA